MTTVISFTFLMPSDVRAGLLGPDNFQECVLDRMPGAANNSVAYEIAGECSRKFPADAPVKKQTGFFAAFHSGSECTLKKAKDTQSQLAARVIQAACYTLYEPPQLDMSTWRPESK